MEALKTFINGGFFLRKNNSAYFPPRIYLVKPDVGFNILEQLGQGLSTKNANPRFSLCVFLDKSAKKYYSLNILL